MHKSRKNKLKKMLLVMFLIIALLFLSAFLIVTLIYINTPLDKNTLSSSNMGIEIYDNSTIATASPVYYTSDKKLVSTLSLQPHTLNAFIAVEDKRFYEHNGYDLKRIAKAVAKPKARQQ